MPFLASDLATFALKRLKVSDDPGRRVGCDWLGWHMGWHWQQGQGRVTQ